MENKMLAKTVKSREEAIALMPQYLTADDMEELGERVAIYEETLDQECADYPGEPRSESMDLWDAFRGYHDLAESVMSCTEVDAVNRRDAKATWIRQMRFLAAVGVYVPISDSAAKDACRSGINVRMAHFPAIDGQRYDFDCWLD